MAIARPRQRILLPGEPKSPDTDNQGPSGIEDDKRAVHLQTGNIKLSVGAVLADCRGDHGIDLPT